MAYNHVAFNGRIPGFDPAVYNEGEGDKASFLVYAINVKRNFKKDDEEYYPDDLITIKAFGTRADRIMKYFKKGDGIFISGRLQRDDDYTNEETGETKRGEMYVLVENVDFLDGSKNTKESSSSNNNSKSGTKPSSKAGSKPSHKPGSRKPGSVPPKKNDLPF